jgi:DNA-binding NarL/FixJ family response regulator
MSSESKHKLRVVVVDDHKSTREGIATLLNLSEDIEVINQVSSGWDALHIIADVGPDIVLMDVQMRFGDGIETTRLIKERWPDVKVIVISINLSYKAEALRAGADCFLLKGDALSSIDDLIRSMDC